MTYKAVETSVQNGAPIELYKFEMVPATWNYTNHIEPVAHQNKTYFPTNIARSKIAQTDEISKSSVNITVPRNFPPADQFRPAPSSQPMKLTIYRKHLGEDEIIQVWSGVVISVSWNNAQAVMDCQPLLVATSRNMLRRYYSVMCSHVLYGTKCRLVAENFKVEAEVGFIDSTAITSSVFGGYADGYFTGGYIEYSSIGEVIEQRTIVSHEQSKLILSSIPIKLKVGATVKAFPGCRKTLNACVEKDNVNNFGGFPYTPVDSPFNKETIF